MKKPHGHYCRICGEYKANEKFSGRGHAAHICKACAKRGNKPPEVGEPAIQFIKEPEDEFDIDSIGFFDEDTLFTEPLIAESPKPKKKRKLSKAKLLRAAQKKKAKELLSRMLADGEKSAAEIQNAAAKAHIPIEALRRAKGSLGIRSIAAENGSVWTQTRAKKER
jgi:hypothetical protein